VTAPDDPEDVDPGLARERTSMAWTRTAISFAAVGALVLKTHLVDGAIVLALALAVWFLRRLFPTPVSGRPQPARNLLLTIAVVAVALVAVAVALLGHAARYV
jgi:uncharacterized membrane protein YidH (DUF202 family)